MYSAVAMQNVGFELPDGRILFTKLNLSLDAGLKAALVGPNGIGKTTLAKLCTGELSPTSGSVSRGSAVVYFPQGELPPEHTVAEYLYPSYRWSLTSAELLAGIEFEQVCSALSGGEWMRVRLARCLSEEFLILDEPTNDLDREGRLAVLRFLEQRSAGHLLISHDRVALRSCSTIFELSQQGLTTFGGGWEAYLEARQRERDNAQASLARAARERDAALRARRKQQERQDRRNRQGRKAARGGMPKILAGGRQRKAETTSAKLDLNTLARVREAAQKARLAWEKLKVDPVMYTDLQGQEVAPHRLVAKAEGFNVDLGRPLYPGGLDFLWRGKIRIALRGGNGSGKTTLVRALLGEDVGRTSGRLRRGDLRVLYLDQGYGQLCDDLSILENVRAVSTASDSELRNGLARLLFSGETVHRRPDSLSGGERLRAALARGLLADSKPEFLVLDEPTNNLDLINIEFLEGIVKNFRGAVLVISHDEEFLEGCELDELLDLDRGGS